MNPRTPLILLAAAYPAWLAMLTFHEFGHILHTWLSGGRVQRIHVPFWGFSFTELSTNPHPTFVAWGGFIWGCVLPLAGAGAARLRWAHSTVTRAPLLFAGFCLIANGAYLAVGQYDGVGDAGDLLRSGVPRGLMITLGSIAGAGGLLLWHNIGRSVAIRRSPVAR